MLNRHLESSQWLKVKLVGRQDKYLASVGSGQI